MIIVTSHFYMWGCIGGAPNSLDALLLLSNCLCGECSLLRAFQERGASSHWLNEFYTRQRVGWVKNY